CGPGSREEGCPWRPKDGRPCLEGAYSGRARGSATGRLRAIPGIRQGGVMAKGTASSGLIAAAIRSLAVAIGLTVLPAIAATQTPAESAGSGVVYRVPVTGVVEMGLAPF